MSVDAEFCSLLREGHCKDLNIQDKRVPVLGEISPLASFECMSRSRIQQVGCN